MGATPVFNGTGGSDTNQAIVTLPTTVAAGDLLMVFVGIDTNAGIASSPTDSTSDAWTTELISNGPNASAAVFCKTADGDEGGGSLTIVHTGGVEDFGAVCMKIPATEWGGTLGTDVDLPTEWVYDSASTSNPEPPSSDIHAWGTTVPTVYVTALVMNSSQSAAPTAPNNYTIDTTNGFAQNGATTGIGSCAVAWRETTSTADDPGTWTCDTSTINRTVTIAVKGVATAISRDTPSVQQNGSVTSPSVTHTISANALVLAWFFRENNTAPSAAATFNGNNMTLLASDTTQAGGGMWLYYYEASEGAGSYTVAGSWAGGAPSYMYIESLTGVASGAPEAYAAISEAAGTSADIGGGSWDSGFVSTGAFIASFAGNPFTSPAYSSVTVVDQEADFATTARALTGFLNGANGSEAPPLWTLSSAVGVKVAIAVSVASAAAASGYRSPIEIGTTDGVQLIIAPDPIGRPIEISG